MTDGDDSVVMAAAAEEQEAELQERGGETEAEDWGARKDRFRSLLALSEANRRMERGEDLDWRAPFMYALKIGRAHV